MRERRHLHGEHHRARWHQHHRVDQPATSFTPSQKLAAGTYTWTIRSTTVDGQQSVLVSNTFVVSGSDSRSSRRSAHPALRAGVRPGDDGRAEPHVGAVSRERTTTGC